MASKVYTEILGGKKRPLKYYIKHCFYETLEVFEALVKLKFSEAYLELQQVIFGFSMWLYQKAEKDFQLYGCNKAVEEFYNRRKVWLELFEMYSLTFKSEYLDGGSNYRRPHKIVQAFGRAGLRIHKLLAANLSRMYIVKEQRLKENATKN